MSINIQQLVKMIQMSQNPKECAMNMLNQNSSNPIMRNVIEMINSNNAQGVEQIARNICKEKGLDPDVLFNQVRNIR